MGAESKPRRPTDLFRDACAILRLLKIIFYFKVRLSQLHILYSLKQSEQSETPNDTSCRKLLPSCQLQIYRCGKACDLFLPLGPGPRVLVAIMENFRKSLLQPLHFRECSPPNTLRYGGLQSAFGLFVVAYNF
jgi:hypothetical protein